MFTELIGLEGFIKTLYPRAGGMIHLFYNSKVDSNPGYNLNGEYLFISENNHWCGAFCLTLAEGGLGVHALVSRCSATEVWKTNKVEKSLVSVYCSTKRI